MNKRKFPTELRIEFTAFSQCLRRQERLSIGKLGRYMSLCPSFTPIP